MGFLRSLLMGFAKDLAVDLFKWIAESIKHWFDERKRKKKIKDGLNEHDSEKVESAIGSVDADKPSGVNGVKVRKRKNRPKN